jgi:signal transduction histidine kinase
MTRKKIIKRVKKNTAKPKKLLKTNMAASVSDVEKYRDLFNRASAGILIVDPHKWIIVEGNNRFYDILDYPSHPKHPYPLEKLKQKINPDVMKDVCRRVLRVNVTQVTDLPIQRRPDDRRYCTIDAAIVIGGGKKVVQIILRDTTERKKLIDELSLATRELEQQYFLLEERNKTQNEFLLNFSNECRSYLDSMITFADIVLEEGRETFKPEHQLEIEAIRRSGTSLLKLIEDVTDWVGIQRGKLVLQKDQVHLASVINEIKKIVSPLLHGKNVQLKSKIPDTIPLLTADANRVRQILLNLVDNALKFTENGHVEIRVATKNNKYIEIHVEDTGIGIHPDHLEAIFEPFRQISLENDPALRKGVGLGLSITKRLVELHQGEIKVQSQVGEGTKFIIRFPFKQPQAES